MSEASGEGVRARWVSPSGIPLLVVAALLISGSGLVAVLVAAHGPQLGPAPKLLVLAGLMAASYRMTGWVSTRLHTPVWQTDAAILAAALVLLDPLGVVVAVTTGVLVGCLLDRRSLAAVVGMVSNSFAMSAAATTIVFGLAGDATQLSARFGLSVAVGIIFGQILWELSFSAWYRLAHAEAFGPSFFSALRFGLPRAPFIAGIGYSAAVASTVVPWAGLFMVPALAGLVYVLAEHFKAERDRARAEILFRTAEAAHAHVEPDEVDAAIVAGAGSLLVSEAELRATPPRAGELGVPIEGAEPRWLIVANPGTGEESEQLLTAIAAVGASALANARMTAELRHQAVHDATTGLPNQLLFNDRVDQVVSRSSHTGERFAVVAVDLDAFRKVNDSLGHAAGDWLLRELGHRMEGVLRDGDTVARLSGDTFMLLLPGVGSAESAGVLTEKLLAAIGRPFEYDG
jgi:GGDEF domain-containing protein